MIDDPNQSDLLCFFDQQECTPVGHRAVPSDEHETPTDEDQSYEKVATAPAASPPRYFSTAEVAEMFGRRPRTIRYWIRTGRLKSIKIGGAVFVSESQIESMVSDNIRPPDG